MAAVRIKQFIIFMTLCSLMPMDHRRSIFEIGIAAEARLELLEKEPPLLVGEIGRGDYAAITREKILGREVHVAQLLVHRVAALRLHQTMPPDRSVLDVDRGGVPVEIVLVAEDFLI